MTVTAENGILFFPGGGHSHNGENSSPIDTTHYSIFDFGVGIQTNNFDTNREYSRTLNQESFNQYIASFISSQILEPAGIVLGENSVRGYNISAEEITAYHIAVGSITADRINANFIEVGDTISSTNYVAGSAGWTINSNGYAEFRLANIGGWTVNTTAIFAGTTILYSNGKTNLINPSISSGILTGGTIGGITVGTQQLSIGFADFANTIAVSNGTGYGIYLNPNGLQIDFRTATATTVGNIKGITSVAGGTAGLQIVGGRIAVDSQSIFFDFGSGLNTDFHLTALNATGTALVMNANNRIGKTTSTREIKNNIYPISDALDTILLLNPVTFTYRYNENSSDLEKFLKDGDVKMGFIVEEVEEVDKGLVHYTYCGSKDIPEDEWFDDPTNFRVTMYDTNGIVSLLTAAVKELNTRIEILEGKL